jgi:hypothetical protein
MVMSHNCFDNASPQLIRMQAARTGPADTIVRALDDQRDEAWDTIFRPMIARVQARLDRIDVDLSVERLVERLFQTNNRDCHPLRRANDNSDSTEAVVRLSLPAQLKRTGKEMKFVVQKDGDERTADPSLVRLIVRADRLARRLAENPGSSLEDVGGSCRYAGAASAVALIGLVCHPPIALADSATLFHATESCLPVRTLKSVSFPSRQKRISNRCRPNRRSVSVTSGSQSGSAGST